MRRISEQTVGCRADTLIRFLRGIGLKRILGGIFFFALLHNPAQAVQSVTLAWDKSPDLGVVGYNIYYGVASGNYTNKVDAGNVTNRAISGLVEGRTYYFGATAYNSAGLESVLSNETGYTVPLSNNLPTVTLTSPANGASFTALATCNLAASVTANGHTITKVQFYNGASLLGEDISSPYSFTWSNVSPGSYSLTARVVYDAGSTIASPSSGILVATATGVTTIWPSTAVPGLVDGGADSSVELGVKFRSDVAGSITGIRFYKASANTGTHVGNLWTSTGTRLATATFTGETASGWQQVNFATPVAISANTVYVASYLVNGGHYSADINYFATSGVDSGSLHALANGVSGGNGVYAYGTSSTFPNLTWSTANYWVDVAFQGGLAATLTSIAVTPTNPNILAGATQQLTATGTYSDGSTRNLTSQAAWASSSAAVAVVNASGLATAVSAGTTTITAALSGVTGNRTLTVSVNSPSIALTAPANGTSYTSPATISLAASVTANGHTITKVQFYNGTTLLGEDTSAPYAITWSSVSAGSYSLSARAVYDTGSTVNSGLATIDVSGTGLPAPWQTADIGVVGAAGSANVVSGVYTVKGAGNLSGTADNLRFVYQSLSGDGEIKVRLNSVSDTGTNARVGVMIRESLTSGSKYAFMGIPPNGTFRWQRRRDTGGSTSATTSTIGTPPNAWVRLVRTGGTLTGYRSTDGVTWTQVNSRSITMATSIYVGLAVASGSSNTLNTATFSNATVVP